MGRRKQASTASRTVNPPVAKADQSSSGRMQRLVALASSLLREAQKLARNKAVADEMRRVQNIDINQGIDFYSEVTRFETSLINFALEEAQGNQAQAARLLGLRPSTLNMKIKLYQIES